MRMPVKTVAAIVVASVLGVASAQMAMGTRSAPPIGPWVSWDADVADDDPYLLARFLMAGRLPPARGQIEEYDADSDSEGRPLGAGCAYRIAIDSRDARWWSLVGSHGAAQSSATSIAQPDGAVVVALSPSPLPGNWLATPASAAFRVTLRVHRWTGAAAAEQSFAPPAIQRLACP